MIKIKRGNRRTEFILSVILILSAAMFSSIVVENPTGMVSAPDSNPSEMGQCYREPYTVSPYTTTFVNCCQTSLPNHRWILENQEVFC